MSRLQPLRDARFIPAALREALGFVYSRHVRNQSTIGGEIAARQEESVLLPVLLALDAELVFGNGENAVNRGLPGLPMRSPANRNYH
ncbi:putative FAD binding molybdopterin dehydrogenase [Escherichia coli]|uniref:Putative FAD binding molybdopterin dehydrogenase n=1 Tax=Escherichia coli TaxID=562 RepID=A0A377AGR0_ECOLX|nr:putative FAD binding molybdopterin dehydrogenase [Escherichia coli]